MSKKTIKRKDRNEQARIEHKNKLVSEHPMNRFLNARNEDDSFKYAIAPKLREYFLNNPDQILSIFRYVNALVHEIRHHKLMSEKCLREYEGVEPVSIRDQFGVIMSREELFSRYIAEKQTIHIVLSNLRKQITEKLIVVTGDLFSLDDYNEYVVLLIAKIAELGYELFPEKVTFINPE